MTFYESWKKRYGWGETIHHCPLCGMWTTRPYCYGCEDRHRRAWAKMKAAKSARG